MSLAMEEFLCTVKRKQAVQMSVSQDLIEFDNLEHPVSIELADVTGFKPTVLSKSSRSVFRAVPITFHDGGCADLNFIALA